jgi:hypothetical protein
MSGKPSSTLAFEKRWNPVLALSRTAFVENMTNGISPKPFDMDSILNANRSGGAQ